MIRTTLRIEKRLHEKLRKESFDTGKSINYIITKLLEGKYVEDNSDKLKIGGIKMETNFNQDLVKVLVRESGGDVEYGYDYFKEGFEEWAERRHADFPGLDNLREYAISAGCNVIKITEKTKMDELIEELKDLIGREFTLMEMDNTIQEIINADPGGKNSIFDGNTKEYIEEGEFAYTIWEDEEEKTTRDVNVYFEIHDTDLTEDIREYTAIITDVELL